MCTVFRYYDSENYYINVNIKGSNCLVIRCLVLEYLSCDILVVTINNDVDVILFILLSPQSL